MLKLICLQALYNCWLIFVSILIVLLMIKLYFASGECMVASVQCLSKAEQFCNVIAAAARFV